MTFIIRTVAPFVLLLAGVALAADPPTPAKGKKASAPADAKAETKSDEAKSPDVVAAPVQRKETEAGAASRTAPPPESEPGVFEGMGQTPEEQAEYKDFSDSVKHYEAESKEFRKEVQLLIEKKYEQKRASLASSYEKAIRDVEVLERKDRLDAIAQLEEFLDRYCPIDRPDQCVDERYVPDVIFRLAELYYEATQDEVAENLRKYEEQLKLVQEGKLAAAPPEPQANYRKAIAQYQRLITQFPNYEKSDGAFYLLGYCLEKQGEFDQASETYTRLIEKYPKSKFVSEAWVRMGEYYFDKGDRSLDKAAHAYTMALAFKDSALYDKAIYKLGWTYYRMDRFDEAVDAFVKLIDFYEQKAKEAGDDKAGGDLRAEALTYTAISFADEKWGSLAKAEEYFRRIGPRPYESELYRHIGDVYFDQTKFKDAITAFKLVLARDPLAKDAPLVQDKVVKSCERLLDQDCAARERQAFADMFGAGTPWDNKNKRDPEARRAANDLVEKSLYSSAVFHHQQAIADKQAGKYDLALREFQLAAIGYDGYLKKFPHSKQAYELSFYYAECLYNSFQFLDAAKAYEAVRDSTVDNKYQGDATYAVVVAYQHEAEKEEKEGKIVKKPVLKNTDRKESEKGTAIRALEIPDIWQHFIKAADRFLAIQPKHDKASAIAYRAAELFYVYNQFDEARKRFQEVMKVYPGSEVAKYAANLTLETWLAVDNYPEILRVTKELAPLLASSQQAQNEIRKLEGDINFKMAEQAVEKGRFDEAAKLYLGVVQKDPNYKNADKALNNAAVAYEKGRRFDSALRLYERIYSEYPKSDLADTALFRVAINSENSYDYDKAVDRYKQLIDKYVTSKNRENAVNNAARVLNALQRYKEAALMNERYAALFPKSEEAPKALYRAALILDKVGDNKGEIKALEDFIRKFSHDPKQVELVVEGHKRIAEAYQKLGNRPLEREYLKKTVATYDAHHLGPDKETASKAAAEAKLKLLADDFDAWDKIKITGRAKELEKSFKNKLQLAKKLQDSYNDIIRFKNVEAILAAYYRKAYCLERLENTLTESACPADIKRKYGEEGCITYQELLVQKVSGVEDAAVKFYQDTLEQCKNYKLMENEFCEKTLESLNRFRPAEYQVLKKSKAVVVDAMSYPSGVSETPEGPRVQSKESKIGNEEEK